MSFSVFHGMRGMLAVVALQQLLFALCWLLAARLVDDRRISALHWVNFCLLVAVAMLFSALRGLAPDWVGIGMADMTMIMGLIALRRAAECFFAGPVRHAEHVLGMAAGLLMLGLAPLFDDPVRFRAVLLPIVLALLAGRTMQSMHPRMAAEFGAKMAWALHGPAALFSLLLLVRAAQVYAQPQVPTGLVSSTGMNASVVLVLLVLVSGIHFAYGGMVVLRLLRRLQGLSHLDALTELANRRALDEQLLLHGRRLQREGGRFSLLVLDVDYFKRVNDRYGHAAGDEVLVALSGLLRAALRAGDFAARSGGEEFVILLPNTDAVEAEAVAQRLCEQCRGLLCRPGGGGELRITVSIGVAELEPDDADLAALLARADAALYQAKQQGRDRVVLSA